MSTFWNRLEKLMKEKQINQTEIAKLCNISNSTTTAWKKGFVPQRPTLKILADYFNVSTDYLLGYTDTQFTNERKEITATEKQIIENYNNSPDGIKIAINKLLDLNF